MKKHFTLVTAAVLLSTAAVTAASPLTSVSISSTHQAPLRVKEVNSSLIEQLKLNENQYIQLRALYSQYKKDASQVQDSLQAKATVDALNKRYYAEVAKILTNEQLEAYKAAAQEVKTAQL